MIKDNFRYRLYGRFKGRKKKLDINELDFQRFQINITKDLDVKNYNILDIGSGNGENIIHLSNLNPNAKIFACDIYQDGNINLLNYIIKKNIKNIKLFEGNVLKLLDLMQPKIVFDEVWILFPDPWPKLRHNKRRLINVNFLNYLSLYLKNKGNINIATDSNSYFRSIIKTVYESKTVYCWKNQKVDEWNYDNFELPLTKFYKKAVKSKRKSFFLRLNKI